MISKVSGNTLSFGAKIVTTPYLEDGLYEIMYKKSQLSLEDKVDFMNAIELIKDDDSFDEFVIAIGTPRKTNRKEARIIIDRKVVKRNSLNDLISAPVQCARNIIDFAKERYGKKSCNMTFLKAKHMSEYVCKKEHLLRDFVNNNLIKNFGKTVFNLPDCNVKLAEMYSERI